MNKKGITPLIATVLVIGFVVVLGVLFWVFASEQVEQFTSKDAAQQAGQAVCATDVSYTVASCSASAGSVSITVNNGGDMPITAVRLRVSGNYPGPDSNEAMTESPLVEDEVRPGQEKTITKSIVVEDPTTVELLPVILYGGQPVTCVDLAKTCTL